MFVFMKKYWNMLCDKIFDLFFAKSIKKVSDELEHENRYALQYVFIPQLVGGISAGKLSVDDFLNFDIWKSTLLKIYGDGFFFRWEELHYEILRVKNEHTIILLEFPKPATAPDALYGAVLVDDKSKKAVYYTLELTFDGDYVLGSTVPGQHFNFGRIEKNDKESFVDWVVGRI